MVNDPTAIRRGMAVYGLDGEKIGVVTRVVGGDTGGDAGAANETMDSLAAGDGPDMSLSEGQIIAGRGSLGPAPTGTIGTEKDRAGGDLAGLASTRVDVHRRDEQRHAEPGAGGADTLRGYGPPEAGTADIDSGGPPATGSPVDAIRGFEESAPDLLSDLAPEVGGEGDGPRDSYILVQDQGTFGVGARGLRVPFSGVVNVVPGEGITLDCTREQAGERYGTGPSLDIDEDADVTPY